MPQRHAGRRARGRMGKRVRAKKMAKLANRIKFHAKKLAKA